MTTALEHILKQQGVCLSKEMEGDFWKLPLHKYVEEELQRSFKLHAETIVMWLKVIQSYLSNTLILS